MKKNAIFYMLLSILVVGCASQRAPSGGPEDKTPPEVIKTMPLSGAVKVPINTEVTLEYSESIDRDTFVGALFIAPDPGDFKVKHKRKKSIIRFAKPLLKDRTYAITLGTNLRDAHNVSLDKSFTFAFATGDSIDQGKISGRVFDDKAQGVVVWAYILKDSLIADPRKAGGDYATQVGKDGRFSIPFMADGNYRIFAVEDAGKTGVYNPVEDRIGMTRGDINLRPDYRIVNNLAIKLTRQDTLGPTISTAGMRNHSTIEIRFDEAVAIEDSDWTQHFTVVDTSTDERLTIHAIAQFPIGAKRFDLTTTPLKNNSGLRITVNDVKDLTGNNIDPLYAMADFSASIAPDTLPPRVFKILPEDKSRNVERDSAVQIIFNEWMDTTDVQDIVTLQDSAGVALPGHGNWDNAFSFRFSPDSLLPPRTTVQVLLNNAAIKDRAGIPLFDTTAVRQFITINPDTLSSITGMFEDQRISADSSAIYQLLASQPGGAGQSYSTTVKNQQKYLFDGMLPGSYIINGFVDLNKNGTYDHGNPVPFKPAEYFFQYPDTIKIRSKWPNDGENITITD